MIAPAKLERKEDVPIGDFFKVDMRIGTITTVLDFPEMRKPSYKIEGKAHTHTHTHRGREREREREMERKIVYESQHS